MINFHGLSEESMALMKAQLDKAPPMTDEQAWEIGRIMGMVPVDKSTGRPLPNPRGVRVRPVVQNESPGITGTAASGAPDSAAEPAP